MTEKVFVLGHRGMLGHVVARYLDEAGWIVCTSDERYDGSVDAPLLRAFQASGCRLVINCLRARDESHFGTDLLMVNTLFPIHLAGLLSTGKTLLVHPSTDAVFDGRQGWREVGDIPDARDGYGLTKRLGESCSRLAPTVVLRASVVGPDLGPPRSLLARVLASEGHVRGYVDHHWNGITSLEWARVAEKAITGQLPPGIHHPACRKPLSKFELVVAIVETYGLSVDVAPINSGHTIDRRLKPSLLLPTIQSQLKELRSWHRP